MSKRMNLAIFEPRLVRCRWKPSLQQPDYITLEGEEDGSRLMPRCGEAIPARTHVNNRGVLFRSHKFNTGRLSDGSIGFAHCGGVICRYAYGSRDVWRHGYVERELIAIRCLFPLGSHGARSVVLDPEPPLSFPSIHFFYFSIPNTSHRAGCRP